MHDKRKPGLIFSPGAWHTGSSFNPTTDILKAQGYKCIALDLPSIGSELRSSPPPRNWDDDVEHIRIAVLHELDDEGVNVVLVAHSYSGTVGSEACEGLDRASREREGKKTWVMGFVCLSAIILDVGSWIWEATGGKPVDETRTVMKGDLCYAQDTASWFYNECEPAQQQALQNQLQSQAWKAFMSKVTYTAWKDIPSWYLFSTNDNAVPIDVQKVFTSYKGGRWKTVTCDGDHSPMMSRVEEVVGIVKMACEEGEGG